MDQLSAFLVPEYGTLRSGHGEEVWVVPNRPFYAFVAVGFLSAVASKGDGVGWDPSEVSTDTKYRLTFQRNILKYALNQDSPVVREAT